MKTIIILFLFVSANILQSRAYYMEKSPGSFLSEVSSEKDSLPDPDDTFIILTSDTAATGKEGIFRKEHLFRSSDGKHCWVDIYYNLVSDVKKIEFYFIHYGDPQRDADSIRVYRKLVLPKQFLDKIEPIDMGSTFPQFKSQEDVIKRFIPHILDMKKSMEDFKRGIRPPRERVWLIDRREMTEDTILLYEVGPAVLSVWRDWE